MGQDTDESFKKNKTNNNKILKLCTACKNQRSHAAKVWPVALNDQLNMLLVEINSLAIEMVCNSILKKKGVDLASCWLRYSI